MKTGLVWLATLCCALLVACSDSVRDPVADTGEQDINAGGNTQLPVNDHARFVVAGGHTSSEHYRARVVLSVPFQQATITAPVGPTPTGGE